MTINIHLSSKPGDFSHSMRREIAGLTKEFIEAVHRVFPSVEGTVAFDPPLLVSESPSHRRGE